MKFLQVTDMSLFPTSNPGGGGSSSTTEADWDPNGGFHFLVSGSFQFDAGNFVGTATQMMIDTDDFGTFPNLDITGFALVSSTDVGSRLAFNPAQFVADVLSGDDTLLGSTGADTILGFAGNDTIDGGLGADNMRGGVGDDMYFVDNAGDTITELVGEGTADRVLASASYTLNGGAAVEVMSTSFNAGTEGINLRGNQFANTIFGNAGSNIISGALGNDTLVGFGGNDFFLFENATAAGNTDVVADFTPGQDHFLLLRSVFTSLSPGTLADANFLVVGTAGQDANDFVFYDQSSGSVFYDADGSAAGAAVRIASVTPNLALHASDFLIV